MTLILSLITHECAFQVADRRLTMTPHGQIDDDNANKLVYFDGRVSFGYTGLAHLGGKRTDDWLTGLLSSAQCSSLPKALRTLASEANEALRGIDRRIKDLAVVGVGWSLEKANLVRPLICRVSNFHDPTGARLNSPADRFTIHVQFLEPQERFTFLCTGQPVPNALTKLLALRMRQFIKKRISRELTLRLMVKVVRATASRNKKVGLDLLSVVLPKASARTMGQASITMMLDEPASEAATFQYWPAGLWNWVNYGPNVAAQGVGIRDFQAGAIKPEIASLSPNAAWTPETNQVESLGGFEIRNGFPSRIIYPCCMLFDPVTDCFISVEAQDKPGALALFTDEDAVNACTNNYPHQLVRVLLRSRDDLLQRLTTITGTDFICLNPTTPRSERCFTSPLRSVVSALRSGEH